MHVTTLTHKNAEFTNAVTASNNIYQDKLQNAEFTNAGHTAQVNSCGSNHLKVLKVLKSAKVGPMQKFKIEVHVHFYTGGVKQSHKKEWAGSLSRNDQMQQMLTLLISNKR